MKHGNRAIHTTTGGRRGEKIQSERSTPELREQTLDSRTAFSKMRTDQATATTLIVSKSNSRIKTVRAQRAPLAGEQEYGGGCIG